jgi:hypothetical protein
MKKLNLNFLKILIETDFVISSFYKDLKRVRLTTSSFNSMHKTASFDLQELIKSLKQTLRLVQFVNSKNENQILVCSSNKQSLKLLNFELESFEKKGKVNIKSGLTKTVLLKNISQVLFLLEDPLLNKKRIFKKLFEDKIYLVNKINLKVEQNNWGAYKVNNDLNSFKKLIFLVVLLRQALK